MKNRITAAAVPGPIVVLNIGCHRCGKRLLRTDGEGRQRAMNDATYVSINDVAAAYCGGCYIEFLAKLGTIEEMKCDDC